MGLKFEQCPRAGHTCPFSNRAAETTLRQLVAQYLTTKAGNGLSRNYLVSVRQYLNSFCIEFGDQPPNKITTAKLERWFDSRMESPSALVSNLGRLGGFFSWLVRRGYLASNPCLSVEKPRIIRHPPTIFTLQQVRDCLDYLRDEPNALAWFVLGTFCGLRPEEADATLWENVRDGVVIVDAQASKVRQRRVVDIETAAVAWLAEARRLRSRLPFPKSTRRRAVRALREHLGWNGWPKDITRHTAASMLLALHQDAGKVAFRLGNSPGVLLTHYRELVTREEAAEFWSIMPSPSRSQCPPVQS